MTKYFRFTLALAVAATPIASWADQPNVDRMSAHLAGQTIPVNINNYVRAETAGQFERILKMTGGINKLRSFREPTPLDKQSVIRMNRDTLYSFAVVDISEGAKLVMPDAEGRYNSAMIVNEDEYINKVFYEPGTHDLTKEEFDTDYVLVAFRTLVDSSDPADIKKANELQDKFAIEAASSKPYSPPNYDEKSYEELRDLLLKVSNFMPNSEGAFGTREDTNATAHLLGAAFGWGGLPEKDAYYLTFNPKLPVGSYHIEVPKDVPVKAFWSVSVYNKNGFFEKNSKGTYNINSQSGQKNADGSMTVNLGGCEDASRVNCIPLTDGWNYTVRLYRPDSSIRDGSWTFPGVEKSD
ncbi:DUF1214 domain-containing protein [Ruegeria marina]|uniref:DUF1214 domain-containing protein n=1 Tax=Ruegeria marina TaxID=639004 RepID=A0A1G6PKX6_9RHOB|nr:DUF1214 domain-containing protein [Ruegeria marina]SDC80047.1 Protein of unknown function [Ruegeria marina]